MTPEDFRHVRTVGLAPGSSIDYFGSFAEVRGAHYRGAYDGELFHILAAEVIKAVHRTLGGYTAPAPDQPRLACRQPSR